ncbi:MAG TPA: hypothetical protein VNF73_07270, partial [Candidatus Saccharimonadales bacterium]|nr:hypothetical protein [Candidatus Saccharimonadales bacterium]
MQCHPLETFERPLDGGPAELHAFGEFADRGLGRGPARVGDHPNALGLLKETALGFESGDRLELAAGRHDRPLQVRRFGIDHAIEIAT